MLAVLALLLVSCGTSGRTLRDPEPGATAPPRKTSSTTAPPVASAPLSLTSPNWTPGAEIPVQHTCDGDDVSPPLTIGAAPDGTVELVLVVRDPDAGGYLHWAVAGIPPGAPAFPAGALPPGAVQLPGASGEAAWVGPCPPAGTTHTYEFTLHALAEPSGLDGTSTEEQLDAAVADATGRAVLTGTYTRPG